MKLLKFNFLEGYSKEEKIADSWKKKNHLYGKTIVISIMPECDGKVNSSAEQFQSNS